MLIFHWRFLLASGIFSTEVKMEGRSSKLSESFMAEPLTPQKTLEEKSSDMKVKMELLIMRIQVRSFLVLKRYLSLSYSNLHLVSLNL